MAKKTKAQAESVPRTVDNSTNPKAKEVYVAWCDHTTMKEVDGVPTNYQMEKDDTFTAAEVPQIWIDMAVAQHWAIRKEDKDKWSNKDLKKNGYSV